jgi:hypothetical protein
VNTKCRSAIQTLANVSCTGTSWFAFDGESADGSFLIVVLDATNVDAGPAPGS